MLKLDFRKLLFWTLSFAFLLVLVVGFGVVDNQIKLSQSNPFLNTFLIDFNNKFLYFRYFGIDLKLQFTFENIMYILKPIISVIVVLFAKIFIY